MPFLRQVIRKCLTFTRREPARFPKTLHGEGTGRWLMGAGSAGAFQTLRFSNHSRLFPVILLIMMTRLMRMIGIMNRRPERRAEWRECVMQNMERKRAACIGESFDDDSDGRV